MRDGHGAEHHVRYETRAERHGDHEHATLSWAIVVCRS
jgi:hypothetical protein